jgi:hypothetical protein
MMTTRKLLILGVLLIVVLLVIAQFGPSQRRGQFGSRQVEDMIIVIPLIGAA